MQLIRGTLLWATTHTQVDGRCLISFPGFAMSVLGTEFTATSTPVLLRWDPEKGTVTGSVKEQEVDRQPYVFRVEYRGRSDLAVTRTFVPDFAAVRGPDPVDVAAVNLVVDGVPPSGLLSPGSELKARVESAARCSAYGDV